ncbi:MAG: hypothetical protein CMH27_10165 [Micavibrio sp.]|nr:hypothetical protein [Micavibrio sp.]|tara:strand:- start:1573 stop:2208 length:636 start_codon:yes stop_codon:yes gene_type:complete
MKRLLKGGSAIFILCLTSACGMNNYAENSLARKNITIHSTHTFVQCHSYGCKNKSDITFTNKDWTQIAGHFSPAPGSAEQERRAIALSIGDFERLIGNKNGTSSDKGGTFRRMMAGGLQLDCVDESINTTIYLQLLNKKDLLRFHDTGAPAVRLPVIHAGRWPHQTATIIEKRSGARFAVDSWFHDNGFPAEVIPLKNWKNGWKPNTILQH